MSLDTSAQVGAPAAGGDVASLPMGVVLLDDRGVVRTANERAAELLRLPHADLLSGSRPPRWRMHDDTGAPLPELAELARQVLRTDTPATVPVVVSIDGEPASPLLAELHPVNAGDRAQLFVTLHPVEADLCRDKGLLDPVTGLPGRALLLDRVSQSLARARTHTAMTSLVLAEVRGLDEINAALGTAGGDEVLATIGRRLRDGLREDYTVARFSCAMFAVLADHPHGTGEPIAARVRECGREPVAVATVVTRPTLHTAWATSDGGDSVPELIFAAEGALRHSPQ